ncbi:MAG: SDR family oxidoreductase [Actinomycetes bacterium]
MTDLIGKTAVVTGASQGIGQATAFALAKAGANVASIHLPDEDKTTQEGIRSMGRRALFVEGTTADSEAVEAFASRVESELGPIDIWVNNAARLFLRPFLETTDADWSEVLASNLNGYVYGCRAAIRQMVARQTGRIVNISSITEHQPIANLSAYATAKGGVAALTRQLALEFGSHGINVNAVAPGAIATPLTEDIYTPEVRATYEARIALGRVGRPEDIADVVVFLASDAARYVTGVQLVADGGMTINGNVGFSEESTGA